MIANRIPAIAGARQSARGVTRLHPSRPWALPIFVLLSLFLVVPLAQAREMNELFPLITRFFPEADRLGEFEGDPPAATVAKGGRRLGYVLLTDEVLPIPAYSGKPISTLVGFNLQGTITGVQIVKHEEPILVVGITDQDLTGFINQYTGKSLHDRVKIGGRPRKDYVVVDGITGATITVMVLNRTIIAAAKKVAVSRGLIGGASKGLQQAYERHLAVKFEGPLVEDPVLDPIWAYAWHNKRFEVVVLAIALGILTLILVFQDLLVRHRTLMLYVRDGFLLFTLFFIGWYSLAQLSVVNVFTFLHAAMRGFRWDSFLIDPLMFMLWGYVAVALILWGRGVYCGWLCPFGALQELSYQVARKLRIPSVEFPQLVHERLWAIKYIVLIGLFGVSMDSLDTAVRYSEIEPFKTTMVLHFQREWWFVAYALGLILVGLFIRKFFCRYLCPLGAALTFPAKFHIFDWLRRHRECGRPCQTCATECEVRAIRRDGQINENECHYCLDCQATYWNALKCPPLVKRGKRRERAVRLREASIQAKSAKNQ
ncbi:MAG: 4Fe-4S binding protein [Pseudomonadota bacterium]